MLQMSKYGFTNMDAVDASRGMLEVARGKQLYTNLIEAYIALQTPMPIADGTCETD